MERYIEFSIGEFYHVYNRGNDKKRIFSDSHDYERFMKLLFICNGRKPIVYKSVRGATLDEIDRGEELVDIGAYCLMPNHFHLLLHEKQENGLTDFMRKLNTAYAMYFNRRHKRTGSLFEGTFRAEHADTDEYLQYLFAYIHLNPVKLIDQEWKKRGLRDMAATKAYLKKYKYSSYVDYISDDDREESAILNRGAFPAYFSSKKEFQDYLNDWLNYESQ